MRRIVLLAATAALVAFVGVAYAVNNKATYTAVMSHKGKPTAKKPANLTYTGTLAVDTDPPGSQPDIATPTTVYFAKGIKQNAKYFPTCKKEDIDGKPAMPASCAKAVVGTGTATAYAGQPGQPIGNSVKETLTVKAINGAPAGKLIMLVVSSTPDAPVAISNRVVPGTLLGGGGAYAYAVRFDIPADLQNQLGLSIALTNFTVKIPGTAKSIKVKGKSVKASFLQLTSCAAAGVPVKADVSFKDAAGAVTKQTSETKAKC